MNKVAILYICTGDYIKFWKGFFTTYEERFLPESEKHYFVFTDAKHLEIGENNPHVHIISQEPLEWPGATLYRFKMFLRIEKELASFNYLFFMNSNLICIETIHEDEFLPKEENLLVVLHPGYFNKKRHYNLPYERRKKSTAYISFFSKTATRYFAGGINGGKTEAFLALIRELNDCIDQDDKNHIVAIWHDESHLNRYVSQHTNYRMLTPAYAYPENWNLPFEKKILILEKKNYIKLDPKKSQPNNNVKPSLFLITLAKIYEKIWSLFGSEKA